MGGTTHGHIFSASQANDKKWLLRLINSLAASAFSPFIGRHTSGTGMSSRHGQRRCPVASPAITIGWLVALLLLLSDLVVVRVNASSFDKVPDPAFTYTLEVDFSSDAEEEEPSLFLDSEIVVDSVLSPRPPHSMRGGAPSMPECIITSRAFLRDNNHNSNYNKHHLNYPFLDLRAFFAADEDDDDDDDDTNDDDGHSSMLSNRSLRRSISSSAATIENVSIKNAALLIRGGGGGGHFISRALSSDMSKKLFVTALVTLVFEGSIGHILEFLKIYMQTSETGTYSSAIRAITAGKGIAGLWDGAFPMVLFRPDCFSRIQFSHPQWHDIQALYPGELSRPYLKEQSLAWHTPPPLRPCFPPPRTADYQCRWQPPLPVGSAVAFRALF
jgi:hypothetical protein